MRLRNGHGQLALGNVLDFFVQRQYHVRAAFTLCFSTIEPALTRVRHHNNLFALAPDLAVQLVFDSAQALFIEIDEAENVRSKVALRINALILLLEVDAFQVQRLHRFFLFGRQLARNPHKRARRFQPCFKDFTWNSQDASKQPRRQLLVAKLRGHRKRRVHGNAHGQRVHVAIVDRAALRRDFNHALLLPLRSRHEFAMKEQLQVSEPPKNGGHP